MGSWLSVLVWIALTAQNRVYKQLIFFFYKNTVEWYQPPNQVKYAMDTMTPFCTLQRCALIWILRSISSV